MNIVLDRAKKIRHRYGNSVIPLVGRAWLKANKNTINFRARHRHITGGNINQIDLEKALNYFRFRCAYCGCTLNRIKHHPKKLSFDHIIPKYKGGCNIPSNLVPCCFKCNNSKHEEYAQEWLEITFGTEAAEQIWQNIKAYLDWLRSGGDYATMLKVQSADSRSGLHSAKNTAHFDLKNPLTGG